MVFHKEKSILAVAIAICCLALIVQQSEALQCMSDTGKTVDWWVAFKYPASRRYSYTDAADTGATLKESTASFTTGTSSCLSYTLNQLWKNTTQVSYIFYNDQPPTTPAAFAQRMDRREALVDMAHAKGVVAVDNSGAGFWLVHSTPLFPAAPTQVNSFTYMDDSQIQNGQSFLCVSFTGWSVWNSVGYNLQVIRPDIYSFTVSSSLSSGAPNLAQAASGTYIHSAVTAVPSLTSKGGLTLKAFAKSGYYGSGWDLYDEFIAPTLMQPLQVETWRQGSGTPLPSNCTARYQVMNINDLNMNGNSWHYTSDHSKWCIASSSSSSWVCICDINRMASQGNRGGGGLCFQSSGLHKSLSSSVTNYSSC